MPKPSPSPERTALAAAHEQLAAAQAALAQAEAKYQQSRRAYAAATDFEELDARIQRLKNMRTHSMWQLRAERDGRA
jgi:hypothetical protein